ncbi:ATP-binding cassette domain-containing protein [Pediococcus ethanolidurans]|uniref:ATP-binding cassette domain-containing protein n=1 Tax=Pediococcus ethanolidurans TaxID=319653 RepID=UPI0021E7FB37|nr:ATP-binding cassette domain-containing protein [Pediococcus ethanolidurans]MCV3315911.1 ATP-binding cassette domain-containing protein [Pediococcus ethanolidurans]
MVKKDLDIFIKKKLNGDKIILKDLNLHVGAGESAIIVGDSGVGKSTLLKLVGLIDQSYDGEICFKGKDFTKLNKEELVFFHNQVIGYVPQELILIDRLSVFQNIQLPQFYSKEKVSNLLITNRINDLVVNADVKMSFFADKVYSVSLLLSLFCELKPDKSGPELSFFSIK